MIDPISLRRFIYDRIVEIGRPPLLVEIAARFGVTADQGREAVGSLGIGKTVLPHPKTGEIWMAGPFSVAPTPYAVRCGTVTFHANCAWDMLGIPAMLRQPAEIAAVCTDCGVDLSMTVDPERGPDVSAVVHFLLPARRWYEDIGFT